ncbi:MAG: MarR family winged helix-turn-helix transcriptional regulator, partial [Acidimicrobiales bacterium]
MVAIQAPAAGTPRATAGADDAVETLERALTEVARSILRMGVPPDALGEGEHVDRSGYWAMARLDEAAGPVRISDLAVTLDLDLSTVSRQVRHLVDTGLVTREADPGDGRACLVGLSDRGRAVLDAVRAARR